MSRIEDALDKAAQRQAVMSRAADNAYYKTEAAELPPPVPVDPAIFPEDKLVVLKAPTMPEAEEFRKLKEALLKAIRTQDGFHNVVLVASAHQGEGKSLTTVNLAISLAQEYDYSVLIVDAEMRMPTCHRYLNITPKLGLANCLRDNLDVGEALVQTGIGKLVLLPAGQSVKNPLELLSSSAMRRLITEMKQRYPDRIILIDSPPVLLFAETRTLADLADGVILVVREGKTSLEDIQECQKLLHNKVLGLVYNATDYAPPSSSVYYTTYYTNPREK